MEKNDRSGPPKPTSLQHKFTFYRYQLVGMAIIFLIPILALFGLFGTSKATTATMSETLLVKAEYPTKFRYKTIQPLEIEVQNLSGASENIIVTVDSEYLRGFSNISFTPTPEEITEEVYIFNLGMVDSEATKVISGEIQAEDYGRFEGEILAYFGTSTISASPNVSVDIATINLP